MLGSIWQYVSGFLGAVLVALGIYTYMTVNGLKLELSETRVSVVTAKADYNMCRDTVSKQNEKIDAVKVEYGEAVKKLDEWKAKPAEIRYNTIYKYVPRKVVENEDTCENIELYIDAVRHIDYNGL